MQIRDVEPVDVRPAVRAVRARLLDLLSDLTSDDWDRSTVCPGWTVKHVALHLLDDDLGRISRERDGDRAGLLDSSGDYRAFVGALNRKNERWVHGAQHLSPRVIRELLTFSGELLDRHFATLDLAAASIVSWAGPEPVPKWFDLARELTEHWVHQQQIRDALGRPGGREHLGLVVTTFMWALPHSYRDVDAPDGTAVAVTITGEGGGAWHLVRKARRWELAPGALDAAAASLTLSADAAWRSLTGDTAATAQIRMNGPAHLSMPFLDARAIIA